MKTWIAPLDSLQRRASRRILLIARGGKRARVPFDPSASLEVFKMSEATVEAPVELTENAARRIAEILQSEPAGAFLRIGVDGGGCSGFTYTYNITTEPSSGDLVIERDGALVAIDPVSLDLLRGSKIDFIDDLMGRMFKIVNPAATASCGCGSSFAI
jgi:iron-sulfur cluster assembly accessory protein